MIIKLVSLCLAALFATTPLIAIEEAVPKQFQVYFSPMDRVDEKLIALINQETKGIRAAIFCLTHRGVIKAFTEAQKRGVKVELILDPFTMKARAPLRRMAQGGITMHMWDPQVKHVTDDGKQRKPLMHNKFCLFEGQDIVWTGSFNFTSQGAIANQENVVVLKDGPSKKIFDEQFQKIKQQGCRSFHDYVANPPKKKGKKKNK